MKKSLILALLTLAAVAEAGVKSWQTVSGGDWGTAANWSPSSLPTSSDAAVWPSTLTKDLTINVGSTERKIDSLTNNVVGATVTYTGSGSITARVFHAAADTKTVFTGGIKATFFGKPDYLTKTIVEGTTKYTVADANPFAGDRSSVIADGEGTKLVISGPDGVSSLVNTYVLQGVDQSIVATNGAFVIVSNVVYGTGNNDTPYRAAHYPNLLRNMTHLVSGTGSVMSISTRFLDNSDFGGVGGSNTVFIANNGGLMKFEADHVSGYALYAGAAKTMTIILDDAEISSTGYVQLTPTDCYLDSSAIHILDVRGAHPRWTYKTNSKCKWGFVCGKKGRPNVTRVIMRPDLNWLTNSAPIQSESYFVMRENSQFWADFTALPARIEDLNDFLGKGEVQSEVRIPVIHNGKTSSYNWEMLGAFTPFYPENCNYRATLEYVNSSPQTDTDYGTAYLVLAHDDYQFEIHLPTDSWPYRGQTNYYGVAFTNEILNKIVASNVWLGGELTLGSDYTLSVQFDSGALGNANFKPYTDACTFTVVATGKGSYADHTAEATFTITRANLVVSVPDVSIEFGDSIPTSVAITYSGNLEKSVSALTGLFSTQPSYSTDYIPAEAKKISGKYSYAESNIEFKDYKADYYISYDPGVIYFYDCALYSIYYWNDGNPAASGPRIAVTDEWLTNAYPGVVANLGEMYLRGKHYDAIQREFVAENEFGLAGWSSYLLGFEGSQARTAAAAASVTHDGTNLVVKLVDMPTERPNVAGHTNTYSLITSASAADMAPGKFSFVTDPKNGEIVWTNAAASFTLPLTDVTATKYYRIVINDEISQD